MYSGK
jgi:hypothetical protein